MRGANRTPFLLPIYKRFKPTYFLPLVCPYLLCKRLPDASLMPTGWRIHPYGGTAGGRGLGGSGATESSSHSIKKSPNFLFPRNTKSL